MAIYPIKLLKDESGQPFIPLTHVNAVAGEEYTTTILTANKVSNGHYKITNKDITLDMLKNKIIDIQFDEIGDITNPAYIKVNNSAEYPIYQADGLTTLILTGLDNSVCMFSFTGARWQLVKVGTDGASGGGHSITNTNGDVMTQRNVLNFDGATVVDDPGNGATKVITNWATERVNTITGSITKDTWTNLLASGMTVPIDGFYRIWVFLSLDNLTSVNKEIGVRVLQGDTEIGAEWKRQYKRLREYFVIAGNLTKNAIIQPQIYVDNIASTDTTKINNGKVYIEYIPKRG